MKTFPPFKTSGTPLPPEPKEDWDERVEGQLKLILENYIGIKRGESIDFQVPLRNGLKNIVHTVEKRAEEKGRKQYEGLKMADVIELRKGLAAESRAALLKELEEEIRKLASDSPDTTTKQRPNDCHAIHVVNRTEDILRFLHTKSTGG